MNSTDGHKRDRTLCAAVGLLALLLSLGSLGDARKLAAQPPTDAVERLRIALAATDNVLPRDKTVRECLDGLHGVGDLRRAVLLTDWKDQALESGLAPVDRVLRKIVADRFVAAVRELLQRKDAATVGLALDMLVEMVAEAKANNESLGLTRALTPDVVALTKSGEPRLCLPAAKALGLIDPDTATAVPVLADLIRSSDANLRRAAADGLANLLPAALATLSHAGRAAHTAEERHVSVTTVNTILTALASGHRDSQVEVRRRCATAVAHAGSGLLPYLTEAPAQYSEDDSELRFQRTVLEEERRDLRPLILGLRDQLPHLGRALKDDDGEVRLTALAALEAQARVRRRWVGQGVWLGGPARGGLQPLVDDPLGDGVQTVLPALATALTDGEVRVRSAALEVLNELGPAAAPAAPAVARALTNGDRFVRWTAVRTLKSIGAPGALPAVPALARLLADPDVDVARAAIDSLVHLDPAGKGAPPRGKHVPKGTSNRSAVPELAQAVKARDAEVRTDAIHALQGMGENARPAVPALAAALGDPDERVRYAAAVALGELGAVAHDAVPDLDLALKDTDATVRRAASDALLRITRAAQP